MALLWFKDFHLSDVRVSSALVVGNNRYLKEESSHWSKKYINNRLKTKLFESYLSSTSHLCPPH